MKKVFCLMLVIIVLCCMLSACGVASAKTTLEPKRHVKIYNATTGEVYLECSGDDFDFYEYKNGYEIYLIDEDGSYVYQWIFAGQDVICEATANAYTET